MLWCVLGNPFHTSVNHAADTSCKLPRNVVGFPQHANLAVIPKAGVVDWRKKKEFSVEKNDDVPYNSVATQQFIRGSAAYGGNIATV